MIQNPHSAESWLMVELVVKSRLTGLEGYLILAPRLTPRNVTHAFSRSPLRACLVCCATTPTNIGL